jgi:hypothetical protein
MFARILRHVEVEESRRGVIIGLWQRELGVNNADSVFPGAVESFESVGALKDEVQAFAVTKVVEEC